MSVLTKKQPASGLRGQAHQAGRRVAPLPLAQLAALQAQAAEQAMPLARTAGTSIRHGADEAAAWASPKVDAARSWAAPQLEHSARAISENLAPMISSALISAAHKIEVPKRKSHQRGRLVASSMLLGAAGCLVAAAIMRLRQQAAGLSGAGAVGATAEPGPDSARSQAGTGMGFETDDGPDPDMNGQSTIT